MRLRRWARGLTAWAGGSAALAISGTAAAGPTNYQDTMPLVWVLVAISAAGAVLTWGVMAYALWKFRDPRTKRRRYG